MFNNFFVDYKYESTDYTLTLYDASGLESYDHIGPIRHQETDVILLCYSLIDGGGTLENVRSRVRSIPGNSNDMF